MGSPFRSDQQSDKKDRTTRVLLGQVYCVTNDSAELPVSFRANKPYRFPINAQPLGSGLLTFVDHAR